MKRRRLAAQLHRLRAASDLTLEAVAEHLECSPAKISRIENGQVAVRIQDARELLDLYEVKGEERENLLQMVRQARRKGWWTAYADILAEDTETLLSLEDEAATISIYESNIVTGLLQTPRYAWELMTSWSDVPLEMVDRKAALRVERQAVLERIDAPALTVVLDEACLHRPVGNEEVMREQYRRLLEVSARPDELTLLILPFSAGAHQAMGFPFHLFSFSGNDHPIVYVELLNKGQFIEDISEIARYSTAFNQVRDAALNPKESREFLEGMIRRP
ncbi:helix-turn-helix transcriptional regulator [Actinomadura fulvescens]